MYSRTIFPSSGHLCQGTPETVFWLRTIIFGGLVFFGYQTPKIPRLAESEHFIRHYLQDALLGFFIGALNGYLIFGSLWYYLHVAKISLCLCFCPRCHDDCRSVPLYA